MNWVGPNAPAHEPLRCSGVTSPRERISNAERNSSRKIVLPAPDTGKRRRRTDDRALADLRSIIGFHAPDGGDEVAIDSVSLFNGIERAAVFGENRLAILHAILIHQDVEIIPDRFGELRLGIEQIHDAQIGRQSRKARLEDRARNAAPLGLRPQAGETVAEIGGGGPYRLRGHERVIGSARFAAPFRRAGGTRGRRRCAGARCGRVEQSANVKALGKGGGRANGPRQNGHTEDYWWRKSWPSNSAREVGYRIHREFVQSCGLP